MTLRTFSIQTLGCKVNQYESEQVAVVLRGRGLVQVQANKADLRIVNTCSVTTEAAAKSRQVSRRMVSLPVLGTTSQKEVDLSHGPAHRVIVMYTGGKVEEATASQLFADPRHPYTQGLLQAAKREENDGAELREIPGTVPSPFAMPKGCSFAPRCAAAVARCQTDRPALAEILPGRPVRCFVAQEAVR